MIGGISNTDYAFRRDAINIRYDFLARDKTELKERYRRRMGYKIAHNWANVEAGELSRNERNRNQALYRLEQQYSLSFLQDLSAESDSEFSTAGTLNSGIFFAIGSGSIIDYIEKAINSGVTVSVGVQIEGQEMRVYKDGSRIDAAIRKAVRQCNKWQKKDESKYPVLAFRFGKSKTSNLVYFTLTATKS